MPKQYAHLQRIDGGHRITWETEAVFVYELHNALLLALRARGTLTPAQYRHAEEKLKHRFRNREQKRALRE